MSISAITGRIAVGFILALSATSAHATEGGSGHYLMGSRDILSGIVPPPGFYVSTDTIAVDSSIRQLTIGGVVLADAEVEVLLTKLNLTASWKGDILGGRPMMSVTVPVATGDLLFDSVTPLGPIRAKDTQTGVGDPVVTFGIGWDKGPTHIAFQTSVFLPLGQYKRASVDPATLTIEALSIGKNRFGFTPVLSITHLPPTGLEFSGALGVSFSTRNKATDYQTAPELHIEAAVAQHLSKQARIGIAGYWYQQLGEDKGTGADLYRAALGTSSLKARVFGVGPVAGYSTKLGKASLTLKAKYTREFSARRRLSGDAVQLSVALGF